jgi:hypothetical protein
MRSRSLIEDGLAVQGHVERGRPEYEVREDAARHLMHLRRGVTGPPGRIAPILVEANPDRVQEEQDRCREDHQRRGHGSNYGSDAFEWG